MNTFDIIVLVLCVVGILCVIISFFVGKGGNDRGAATNKSLNDMSKITLAKTSDRMESLVKSAEEEFEEFAKTKVDAAIKEIEDAGKKSMGTNGLEKSNANVSEEKGSAEKTDLDTESFADEPTEEIAADELEKLDEFDDEPFMRKNNKKKNSKGKNNKGKSESRQYGWGEALAIASAEENKEDTN